MNTEIKIFENAAFGTVRTTTDEQGNAWFVGKDVASILGYKNSRDALSKHVDDEDKTTVAICDTGSNYKSQAVLINESGLYSLVLSSKLDKARKFKRWVTSEVLPQIRKTGGYIPSSDDEDEKTIMARALQIANKTIELKNLLLAEQKPLVRFANAVTAAENSILIRDLAKLITQNGVKIGQARLFYWLRLHGYLFQHELRPMQRWVEKGLFETNVTMVGTLERLTTKVTGKGQEYFVNGFVSGKFKPTFV